MSATASSASYNHQQSKQQLELLMKMKMRHEQQSATDKTSATRQDQQQQGAAYLAQWIQTYGSILAQAPAEVFEFLNKMVYSSAIKEYMAAFSDASKRSNLPFRNTVNHHMFSAARSKPVNMLWSYAHQLGLTEYYIKVYRNQSMSGNGYMDNENLPLLLLNQVLVIDPTMLQSIVQGSAKAHQGQAESRFQSQSQATVESCYPAYPVPQPQPQYHKQQPEVFFPTAAADPLRALYHATTTPSSAHPFHAHSSSTADGNHTSTQAFGSSIPRRGDKLSAASVSTSTALPSMTAYSSAPFASSAAATAYRHPHDPQHQSLSSSAASDSKKKPLSSSYVLVNPADADLASAIAASEQSFAHEKSQASSTSSWPASMFSSFPLSSSSSTAASAPLMMASATSSTAKPFGSSWPSNALPTSMQERLASSTSAGDHKFVGQHRHDQEEDDDDGEDQEEDHASSTQVKARRITKNYTKGLCFAKTLKGKKCTKPAGHGLHQAFCSVHSGYKSEDG